MLRRLFCAMGAALLAISACSSDDHVDDAASGAHYTVATSEPDHLTANRTTIAFDEIDALYAPLVRFAEDGELVLENAASI
jgi:hypothetical protein